MEKIKILQNIRLILTICTILSTIIFLASCNSMQSIRNGGYNFYTQNNKKKLEQIPKMQEIETIKPNTSSIIVSEKPRQQDVKAIAGEVVENKQPCENEELDFMKMKIDKLEEEIKILRREIENLVDIIINQVDKNKRAYSDVTFKEPSQKTKSQRLEKKFTNSNNTKKNQKNNNLFVKEKKSNDFKELQVSLQQNKKVEEVVQLIKDKRYNEALKLVDSFLKEESDISTISVLYYWKGEALFYTKEYSKALECFQKVVSFPKASKRVESQIMIAECYTRLGKLKEAKREYQKFIEEFPFSEYTPRAKRMIQQL